MHGMCISLLGGVWGGCSVSHPSRATTVTFIGSNMTSSATTSLVAEVPTAKYVSVYAHDIIKDDTCELTLSMRHACVLPQVTTCSCLACTCP